MSDRERRFSFIGGLVLSGALFLSQVFKPAATPEEHEEFMQRYHGQEALDLMDSTATDGGRFDDPQAEAELPEVK